MTGQLHAFDTPAKCAAAVGTWVDRGNCTNGQYTNAADCLNTGNQEWNRENVNYAGKGSICMNNASTAANLWWNGSNSPGQRVTQANKAAEAAQMYFRTSNWRCSPVSDQSNGGGDQWTSEYQSLAKVNKANKTLQIMSDDSEQAIRLWVIGDDPYYSSFDTAQGKYLLKRGAANQAQREVLSSNFEASNLSEGNEASQLFYDGLNFVDNSYSFGTIDLANSFAKTMKTGLTGTLKTIFIIPK